MREAVFELLERINKLDDRGAQINELRKAANGRFQELLQYSLHPAVVFDLPEGPAPFKPTDDTSTHGLFWQEIRRLYVFQKGRTQLPAARREQIYIEMLENIHPKDAELLQLIKDRKWPYENISLELVNEAFPLLIGE